MEFLDVGFVLRRPGCYGHLGDEPVDERVLSLSLSLSLPASAFKINTL